SRIRLDPLGVVLISTAALCLIYPLVQGRELGWPLWTFGLMVAGLALIGVFAGLVMVTSLFFQLGLHFSPEHAGLTLVPLSLGTAVTAGASYALMPRFGRKVLQGGVLVVVAGLVALAWTVTHFGVDVTSLQMAPANLLIGLGLGFIFGPLFNVILAGVDD